MGEAKNRKMEIEALKAMGKRVEHTREERIAALMSSMRDYPSWWEQNAFMWEHCMEEGGKVVLGDPWGGYDSYAPSFLLDLWKKVKAA